MLKRELWWKVVQPPDSMALEEAEQFTQGLVDMAKDSLSLLKRVRVHVDLRHSLVPHKQL